MTVLVSLSLTVSHWRQGGCVREGKILEVAIGGVKENLLFDLSTQFHDLFLALVFKIPLNVLPLMLLPKIYD